MSNQRLKNTVYVNVEFCNVEQHRIHIAYFKVDNINNVHNVDHYGYFQKVEKTKKMFLSFKTKKKLSTFNSKFGLLVKNLVDIIPHFKRNRGRVFTKLQKKYL